MKCFCACVLGFCKYCDLFLYSHKNLILNLLNLSSYLWPLSANDFLLFLNYTLNPVLRKYIWIMMNGVLRQTTSFVKLLAMTLTPFITVPHKSVTTENHTYWTLSLHYLPATPCLSALETSNTLCLFFCISNQHVMRPTRLLKQHERLLLYNSILECVRAKKGAVCGVPQLLRWRVTYKLWPRG